jgi:CheY-like chemotaxis protein
MADKILVVDDDPDTVKFINIMLSRLGYQVVSAVSGMEALERVQVEHPDLIILDVMMPGMDGYEVSAAIPKPPPRRSLCSPPRPLSRTNLPDTMPV